MFAWEKSGCDGSGQSGGCNACLWRLHRRSVIVDVEERDQENEIAGVSVE